MLGERFDRSFHRRSLRRRSFLRRSLRRRSLNRRSLLRCSALHVPAMNTQRCSAAECTEPQRAVAGGIAALLGGSHAAPSLCNDKQAAILPIYPSIKQKFCPSSRNSEHQGMQIGNAAFHVRVRNYADMPLVVVNGQEYRVTAGDGLIGEPPTDGTPVLRGLCVPIGPRP